jgi:hypothetical protein
MSHNLEIRRRPESGLGDLGRPEISLTVPLGDGRLHVHSEFSQSTGVRRKRETR